MLSQIAVFTQRVGDHMMPAPVAVPPATSCMEVVRRMREVGASSAVVEDAAGRAVGIVTEQDVCRRITGTASENDAVEAVMSAPVVTIAADDYLYHAIAHMRRHGLRHMPVVDATGRVVGALELHRALGVAAARMVGQIERLTRADTPEGLKDVKQAQVQVALELESDAVPAPEIQTLLSRVNDDIYRHVVELCLRDMSAAGRGEPPVDFEVIVMGSGGRGESFLRPDQDNGFILADYPAEEHARIDGWFIELAERVTDALDSVGFPYCNGNVMATNPLWRKSISEWCEQTSRWLWKSEGLVLRLCDIFFDFTAVYGSGRMAKRLREHITANAPHPVFLRELFKIDEEHGVALGLFGRLKRDPLPGPNKGKINLKLTGTMPLVGAVRIMALRERIRETSTLARLDALRSRGVLDADEADYLAGTYRHVCGLLLRQQLADFRAGAPVGNHVAPEALSEREKDMLVDGFKAIRAFRARLRHELLAEVF